MTLCDVHDKTTGEREQFCSVSAAKKWMRERAKLGHEVNGAKTRVWASGEWEPAGPITLGGSNAVLMANTRATKPGY